VSSPIPGPVLERLRNRSPGTRIAVFGASSNPEKYGNIIVGNLHGKGYTVLPVNPREDAIRGLPAFRDAAALPDPVHVAVLVTPPAVTLGILSTIEPGRFPVLWLQDGSFDDRVLALAEDRFPAVVHHACIMVVTGQTAASAP